MTDPHPVPSHIHQEVASQPDCWRRAGAVARDAAGALPRAGERVAVVGCGTSLYIAQAIASLREARGQGETDAFPASETPLGRDYDCVLALTRSGTTSEVLELLNRLRGRVRCVAVTANGSSPVVAAADEAVVLDFADEESVVQTRFATSALVLGRAHFGEDVAALVAAAEEALAAPLPHDLAGLRQLTFLGRGWTVGVAREASLKLCEATLSWADAYPAMEYRHGPIALADERTLVWMLGAAPDGLANDVARTGAVWEHADRDPLAELVRVHRVAVELAAARGLDPDRPRNLTRSVVLNVG